MTTNCDPDILVYEIETKYFYDDFSQKLGMFDFSNYFARSKYYLNALVVGKIKDKMGRVAIEEFVGWKSKMY